MQTQITFDATLYTPAHIADMQRHAALSFVAPRADGDGCDYWTIAPTGDEAADDAAGRRAAKEIVAYLRNGGPGDVLEFVMLSIGDAHRTAFCAGLAAELAGR